MHRCINCGKSTEEMPLLEFSFNFIKYYICSGCLPILLHSPGKLADKLPGAENIQPAKH